MQETSFEQVQKHSNVFENVQQEFAEFDDLCPSWAENIRHGNGFSNCGKSFQERNLGSCKTCLVGEAHE